MSTSHGTAAFSGYPGRIWDWLNLGLGGSLFIGLLLLGASALHAHDGQWAVLTFFLAAVVALLPPMFFGVPGQAVRAGLRPLAFAVAAGVLTGIVGWKAGLGYGALTLGAVASALLAGAGIDKLQRVP